MNYEYILTSDGELFHHGVKGQKWGVRRYQNKDGSLTAAGKKRLAASNDVTYSGSKGKGLTGDKSSSNSKPKKTEAELMDEIIKRKAEAADRGRAAAVLALAGVAGLGLNALTAATVGMVELKTLATGAISAGGAVVVSAMAGVESIKVATLEKQLENLRSGK